MYRVVFSIIYEIISYMIGFDKLKEVVMLFFLKSYVKIIKSRLKPCLPRRSPKRCLDWEQTVWWIVTIILFWKLKLILKYEILFVCLGSHYLENCSQFDNIFQWVVQVHNSTKEFISFCKVELVISLKIRFKDKKTGSW